MADSGKTPETAPAHETAPASAAEASGKEPETAPAPTAEASEQEAVPAAAAVTTTSASEAPADILPASHWAQVPVRDFPHCRPDAMSRHAA